MHTRAFILASLLGLTLPGQPVLASDVPQCLSEPVVLQRFGGPGPLAVSLTDCDGKPNPGALAPLATLAQPQPKAANGAAEPPAELRDRLNPELLVRLQRLATQFPEHTIEIVSGYRVRGRAGSRHRSGDALDVRIEGVDNAELSAFARTLEATGVGYYPNSTFVHIDVRPTAAYWVDRSGPGEAPEYVRLPAEPADASEAGAELADGGEAELHGPELPLSEPEQESATAAEPDAIEAFAAELGARDSVSSDADADADAEPVADADAAELAADLRSLAERALIVMQANEVI